MNKAGSKHIVQPREKTKHPVTNSDLLRYAKASRAHDWLRDPAQDIYSLHDGKPAQWPKNITGAA